MVDLTYLHIHIYVFTLLISELFERAFFLESANPREQLLSRPSMIFMLLSPKSKFSSSSYTTVKIGHLHLLETHSLASGTQQSLHSSLATPSLPLYLIPLHQYNPCMLECPRAQSFHVFPYITLYYYIILYYTPS